MTMSVCGVFEFDSAKRKKRTDTRTDVSPSESYIYQTE